MKIKFNRLFFCMLFDQYCNYSKLKHDSPLFVYEYSIVIFLYILDLGIYHHLNTPYLIFNSDATSRINCFSRLKYLKTHTVFGLNCPVKGHHKISSIPCNESVKILYTIVRVQTPSCSALNF